MICFTRDNCGSELCMHLCGGGVIIIIRIILFDTQGLVQNHAPSTSTEKENASSPLPKKKTAMSEVFGDLFKTEEQQTRPFPQITEEEVITYKLEDSIHVDADSFMWWKTN